MKRTAVLEPELAADPAIAADWPMAQRLLEQWPEQWDEVSVRPAFWEEGGTNAYRAMAYQFVRGDALVVVYVNDLGSMKPGALKAMRDANAKRVEHFMAWQPKKQDALSTPRAAA